MIKYKQKEVNKMIGKNIKYYRLKNHMTKAELAKKAGLSAMAITHYENGERQPDLDTIRNLAGVLNVSFAELSASRKNNLVFSHNQFSCNRKLTLTETEYIKESVEEYFGRFFTIIDILGETVLPNPLCMNEIMVHEDIEINANNLRRFLRLSENGSIKNITQLLEDKGILIYFAEINIEGFYGINGYVNGRPYIAVNANMSDENKRMTLVHEFAHMALFWPDKYNKREQEKMSDRIAEAFLMPRDDLIYEVGISRSVIAGDMLNVCKKYCISFSTLIRILYACKIIAFKLMKKINSNEEILPYDIKMDNVEEPELFHKLVIRAASEGEISISKAVELLKISILEVRKESYSLVG